MAGVAIRLVGSMAGSRGSRPAAASPKGASRLRRRCGTVGCVPRTPNPS